jgi:hypothetical protein
MQKVRAKMKVSEVTDQGELNVWDKYEEKVIPTPAKKVVLFAVTGGADEIAENEAFNRSTPVARFEMTIVNTHAAEFFQVGDEFYADFTRAG